MQMILIKIINKLDKALSTEEQGNNFTVYPADQACIGE